jgi:hypothetical protein
MSNDSPDTHQPIGFQAYTGTWPPDVRPDPPRIDVATFADEAAARAWVEQGRNCCTTGSFVGCIVPVYGAR